MSHTFEPLCKLFEAPIPYTIGQFTILLYNYSATELILSQKPYTDETNTTNYMNLLQAMVFYKIPSQYQLIYIQQIKKKLCDQNGLIPLQMDKGIDQCILKELFQMILLLTPYDTTLLTLLLSLRFQLISKNDCANQFVYQPNDLTCHQLLPKQLSPLIIASKTSISSKAILWLMNNGFLSEYQSLLPTIPSLQYQFHFQSYYQSLPKYGCFGKSAPKAVDELLLESEPVQKNQIYDIQTKEGTQTETDFQKTVQVVDIYRNPYTYSYTTPQSYQPSNLSRFSQMYNTYKQQPLSILLKLLIEFISYHYDAYQFSPTILLRVMPSLTHTSKHIQEAISIMTQKMLDQNDLETALNITQISKFVYRTYTTLFTPDIESTVAIILMYIIIAQIPQSDQFIYPYCQQYYPTITRRHNTTEEEYIARGANSNIDTRFEIVDEIDPEQNWSPYIDLDDFFITIIQWSSDLVMYPWHFTTEYLTWKMKFNDVLEHSTNFDEQLLYITTTYEDTSILKRYKQDYYRYNTPNSYSIVQFLLSQSDMKDLNIILPLLTHTRQLELTTLHRPYDLHIPLNIIGNYGNGFYDGFHHTQPDFPSLEINIGGIYLLTMLVQKKYPIQVLQSFLHCDDLNWDLEDEFGYTILDYCIIYQTYIDAYDFVVEVIKRTNCAYKRNGFFAKYKCSNTNNNDVNEFIIPNPQNPKEQHNTSTSLNHCNSYIDRLFTTISCDQEIPYTFLQVLAQKTLFDRQLLQSQSNQVTTAIANVEISTEPLQFTSETEINFIETNILSWLKIINILSLPIFQIQSNQSLIFQWIKNCLDQYLIKDATIPIQQPQSLHDFAHSSSSLSTPQLTQYDLIYVIYLLIDLQFSPNMVEILLKYYLSPQYYYQLYYFYQLPPAFHQQLINTNNITNNNKQQFQLDKSTALSQYDPNFHQHVRTSISTQQTGLDYITDSATGVLYTNSYYPIHLYSYQQQKYITISELIAIGSIEKSQIYNDHCNVMKKSNDYGHFLSPEPLLDVSYCDNNQSIDNHPIQHNISPTIIDLILNKTNMIPYLMLLYKHCQLTTFIYLNELTPSIYQLGTTYLISLLSKFMIAFSQFIRTKSILPSTTSKIYHQYYELYSTTSSLYTIDGHNNLTTIIKLFEGILPLLSSTSKLTKLNHNKSQSQQQRPNALLYPIIQSDTLNTKSCIDITIPTLLLYCHYIINFPITLFQSCCLNGIDPNLVMPYPPTPFTEWSYCQAQGGLVPWSIIKLPTGVDADIDKRTNSRGTYLHDKSTLTPCHNPNYIIGHGQFIQDVPPLWPIRAEQTKSRFPVAVNKIGFKANEVTRRDENDIIDHEDGIDNSHYFPEKTYSTTPNHNIIHEQQFPQQPFKQPISTHKKILHIIHYMCFEAIWQDINVLKTYPTVDIPLDILRYHQFPIKHHLNNIIYPFLTPPLHSLQQGIPNLNQLCRPITSMLSPTNEMNHILNPSYIETTPLWYYSSKFKVDGYTAPIWSKELYGGYSVSIHLAHILLSGHISPSLELITTCIRHGMSLLYQYTYIPQLIQTQNLEVNNQAAQGKLFPLSSSHSQQQYQRYEDIQMIPIYYNFISLALHRRFPPNVISTLISLSDEFPIQQPLLPQFDINNNKAIPLQQDDNNNKEKHKGNKYKNKHGKEYHHNNSHNNFQLQYKQQTTYQVEQRNLIHLQGFDILYYKMRATTYTYYHPSRYANMGYTPDIITIEQERWLSPWGYTMLLADKTKLPRIYDELVYDKNSFWDVIYTDTPDNYLYINLQPLYNSYSLLLQPRILQSIIATITGVHKLTREEKVLIQKNQRREKKLQNNKNDCQSNTIKNKSTSNQKPTPQQHVAYKNTIAAIAKQDKLNTSINNVMNQQSISNGIKLLHKKGNNNLNRNHNNNIDDLDCNIYGHNNNDDDVYEDDDEGYYYEDDYYYDDEDYYDEDDYDEDYENQHQETTMTTPSSTGNEIDHQPNTE